ncbi:hypothetical protein QCA50_021169 [Cerrena zonata]|uniref:Uncharacterized protein n=1 Tax=Cerrena zonata TaxID=2478898 RepID=A0AAW0FGV6_9APHY
MSGKANKRILMILGCHRNIGIFLRPELVHGQVEKELGAIWQLLLIQKLMSTVATISDGWGNISNKKRGSLLTTYINHRSLANGAKEE